MLGDGVVCTLGLLVSCSLLEVISVRVINIFNYYIRIIYLVTI